MKENARIKKLRNRIIVLCVVTLFFIVGYYFLYSSLNKMKMRDVELQSDIITLQSQVDNAALLKRQYNDQSAQRSKIESYIIKKGSEADFISAIETLATNSGLQYEIISVDVQKGDTAENLQNLHLKLSVTGNWQDLYQFLQLAENLPYSSSIGTVDLVSNGQPSVVSTSTGKVTLKGKPQWQGNLDIRAASFK